MNSSIADGDLGPTTSFALEVRGLVHVAVDVMANASYSVSGGKMVQTLVHSQSFGLEGLFQGPNALGDLASFGMVSAEILDFPL